MSIAPMFACTKRSRSAAVVRTPYAGCHSPPGFIRIGVPSAV